MAEWRTRPIGTRGRVCPDVLQDVACAPDRPPGAPGSRARHRPAPAAVGRGVGRRAAHARH